MVDTNAPLDIIVQLVQVFRMLVQQEHIMDCYYNTMHQVVYLVKIIVLQTLRDKPLVEPVVLLLGHLVVQPLVYVMVPIEHFNLVMVLVYVNQVLSILIQQIPDLQVTVALIVNLSSYLFAQVHIATVMVIAFLMLTRNVMNLVLDLPVFLEVIMILVLAFVCVLQLIWMMFVIQLVNNHYSQHVSLMELFVSLILLIATILTFYLFLHFLVYMDLFHVIQSTTLQVAG
jgi:hypothetical protein